MADPNLTELEATTQYEIFPKVIEDNWGLDTPEMAYYRDHCLAPWGGGQYQQSTFSYAPMIGGFYGVGANFNITKPKTIEGTVFELKQLEVNVTEYLELLELNRGPLAVFNLVQEDLANAIKTANVIMAVASHRHGQNIAGQNRLLFMNGMSEALNDGITNSWDGNVFPLYGNVTRNGSVTTALNSVPHWCGTAAGAPGMLTYNVLEETYQSARKGRLSPDLGVCNKAAYAFCKERMQAQQRFSQERDPIWGVTSFRFEDAMILPDEYFPSAVYGRNDPLLGNWLTAPFLSSAAPDTTSRLPALTNVTPGEVFAWFHTPSISLRVSTDPNFNFAFTGFKVAQDNTRVAGQILAKVNLVFNSCRLQKHLYGINA